MKPILFLLAIYSFNSFAENHNMVGMYYCEEVASVGIEKDEGKIYQSQKFKVKIKDRGFSIIAASGNILEYDEADNNFSFEATDNLVTAKTGNFNIFQLVKEENKYKYFYSYSVMHGAFTKSIGLNHYMNTGTCNKW